MLLPYLPVLNNKRVILGSQSKSRNELVQAQRLKYTVIPSAFAEDLDKSAFPSPADYNLVWLQLARKPVVGKLRIFWGDSPKKESSGTFSSVVIR
jgi:hypothetical protein